MAKATLEFNLPEEQVEFDMACKARDMHNVLCALNHELRSHLKYTSHPEWHGDTVEDIRKILNDLIDENCIYFN